ncbi:M14 family metallopeptidase [Pseudozobellia sp. WGM2]|uniref:succinylglutamate desuccinylase/aspartoacylase family protein n=1 Tax=Pseudozobellia sp. WGM2 TaxID=2787625 RepID=UPI001ADF601C
MRNLFSFIALLIGHTVLLGQNSFSFEGRENNPGSKNYYEIQVSDGKDSTFIPVTVFHGAKPGPVLGITAGIHGYEYPPILAAQKIIEKLDAKQLSGTVILVQMANIPAFLGRSPFLNPLDGKNLNRSFPGEEKGSITARLAHTITQKIIARSDFFVDMHAGDSPEDLMPYNAWYNSEAFPEASKKGKAMALAMGFDYTIRFQIAKERVLQPSLYCSQEAFHRQIPTVDIECGRLGMSGEQETNKIVSSIFSLLSHLQMMPNENSNSSPSTIITQRTSVKSDHTGIFYSEKHAGDSVTKGESIGYITNFFGEQIKEVTANASGIILYKIGTPPINKGDTLFNIGHLP